MEALSVTIEDLTQTAGGIRQENQTLRKCLMEIHVCMNQLTNEWQSPAATYQDMEQKLNQHADSFR